MTCGFIYLSRISLDQELSLNSYNSELFHLVFPSKHHDLRDAGDHWLFVDDPDSANLDRIEPGYLVALLVAECSEPVAAQIAVGEDLDRRDTCYREGDDVLVQCFGFLFLERRALLSAAATACFCGCPEWTISRIFSLTTFLLDPRFNGIAFLHVAAVSASARG